MSSSPIKKKTHPPHQTLPDNYNHHWFNDPQALKNVVLKMRLQSLSSSTTPPSEPDSDTLTRPEDTDTPSGPDYAALLSDQLLMTVLSKLPVSQLIVNCLVCKRWSKVNGSLVSSVKVKDWDFLESGRLVYRFPNLVDVNVVESCIISPRNSGILLSHKLVSFHVNSLCLEGGFVMKKDLLNSHMIDRGIQILAQGCRSLRKLVLIGASDEGLGVLANECLTLQDLELHCCNDFDLKGITGCQNLQILKLIGCINGLYDSVISDIGLTVLAQGCKRLLKLELVGCEGSYDGVKAIGQCCLMLEELTLCDHRFEGGWLSALPYCGNLKTLKLESCKIIDTSPGPDEHLGCCRTLEELHLQRCQMRDKEGVRALFLVCEAVRELVFEDCWGLDDNVFCSAIVCRRVTFLSLEGCSKITMDGLDPVVLSWKELKRLKVISCNSIKDSEVTPGLAALFCTLKELKWRPDSRSLLSSGLAGTGIGQKSGRGFKRM